MIMPVWRPHEDWLLAAVESVLAQEESDLELIVVDDGSPEPVADLLSSVEDPRLRVIRVANGGAGAARNVGIEAARGELVRFVDGDDVLERGSTARLVTLAGGETVITYGATLVCDEALRPLFKMVSKLEGDGVVDCLLGRFPVRHVSLLFPKSVVDAIGGWDPAFRVSGDWDFVLRALEHAPVRGEDAVATYYRKHAESLTAEGDVGQQGAQRVVERYFARHPEQRGTGLERRAYARLNAFTARVHLTRGAPIAAIRAAALAARLSPAALWEEGVQSSPGLLGLVRRLARRSPSPRR